MTGDATRREGEPNVSDGVSELEAALDALSELLAPRVARLLADRPVDVPLAQEGRPDPLLTVQDVAHRASVSSKTVYRAIRCGELLAGRITAGGPWRIEVTDSEAWVASRGSPSDSQPARIDVGRDVPGKRGLRRLLDSPARPEERA